MESDFVTRCRVCGAPLEMVHGRGSCLSSGCPLFGQVQEDCCSGAPEPTEEGGLPKGQRTPAPIPWRDPSAPDDV